ncbi:hypothetical protein BD309DRAFT_347730 [Dichomitus squalens]|uniref:Uncharacterized protein n=1 Tax=Dichomitus squalens TaxID=114155 RepID=A0A4Q9Q4L4_9APHY|nr:hypothetical protein BD311DRAFT_746345 [Dichomitus squalens]TBU48178.1 hypothetical protein BD309DRAFT_347730 [Dichomitus squalens]TBU62020.1 hypothetical protein BD310DRAFT_919451 [Dichomitus squalens]
MPASTETHDLTLTLHNDTTSFVTVQVLRDNGGQPGITIYMRAGEDLTLVVMSGTLYRYVVERHVSAHIRKVEMSVKIWYDTKCRISDIFSAPYSPYRCGCNQNIKLAEGINVAYKGWAQDGASAQGIAQDPCREHGRQAGRGTG